MTGTSNDITLFLKEAEAALKKADLTQAKAQAETILSIDSNHARAKNILDEVKRRERLLQMAQAKPMQVTQLRCQGCSQTLTLHSPGAKGIVCSSCGTIADPSAPGNAALKVFRPDKFPPNSFIRLGLKGTFYDKKYEVIGRISYQARIEEWDAEDNCYCNEKWESDEWILVGENKDYLYLSEDAEGYSLSRSFVPKNPNVGTGKVDFLDLHGYGGRNRVQERGVAEAVYFEGEFTWVPEKGERVQYAEYTVGEVTYCVEYRVESSGKIEEVEYFEARPCSSYFLLRAFDLKEELAQYEKELAQQKQFGRWGAWFYMAGGALLLMFLVSLVLGGKEIYRQTIAFSQLKSEEGLVLGPIALNNSGSVYRLQVVANLPDNTEAWAGVELLDEESEPVNEFSGEFWRESGVDSDGHWSESDTTSSHYFRLETPGQYFAQVVAEPGVNAGTGNVSVSVAEGVILSRYFLLASVLSFGYGYAIRKRKSLNPIWFVLGIVLLAIVIAAFIRKHSEDD